MSDIEYTVIYDSRTVFGMQFLSKFLLITDLERKGFIAMYKFKRQKKQSKP